MAIVDEDDEDELDTDERRALEAAITVGLRQAERGELTPAAEILARLRARRV